MNEVSTNDRVIPDESQVGMISFEILIEGNRIAPETEILAISVQKEIYKIPTATIVLKDGDSAAETFAISEQETFIPGKKIEIKGGRDGINATLFKGIIVRHAIKITGKGTTSLTLECKDETVKTTIGRKNKYFENTTDSDCIRQILGNYDDMIGDLEDTNVEHAELVQHHVTDWDFINIRAEANGKILLVDDGKVSLKVPIFDESALTVIYGSTIVELEAEMDARNQWANVKTSAWNYTSQEMEDFDTSSVDFREHGNLQGSVLAEAMGLENYELRHSGQLSSLETEHWTKAALLKSRMAKIRGRVKFTGFAALKPGKWLTIQGVGNRFNGTAYVSAIRQEYINGGWYTHAQFGVSPEWFSAKPNISDFSSGGLIPAVNGLQIGKVVQLENDPAGEDRILIKLPTLDNNARGIWMRVACLDAGNERGSFFRPEIDDEVIVGFINNDPREGIVLGQLNSSAKPAPIVAQDSNHIKGIYTRSKMKVEFDDEKSIMTFETPAGNKIIISDDEQSITLKDQTNNEIKMSPSGIEITSPKDIKISATGKIDMEAIQNMTIAGLMTEVKANTALSLKGTANATLDGGPSVAVKGAMVMLG